MMNFEDVKKQILNIDSGEIKEINTITYKELLIRRLLEWNGEYNYYVFNDKDSPIIDSYIRKEINVRNEVSQKVSYVEYWDEDTKSFWKINLSEKYKILMVREIVHSSVISDLSRYYNGFMCKLIDDGKFLWPWFKLENFRKS